MNPLIDIMIRSVSVYLFMLIAIRLSGKKEISQLSIVDLVLILLISNAVQNAMVGPDSSLVGGIVAAATLFVLNYLIKLLVYRFPKIGSIMEGEEVMLIYKGNVIEEALKKERISFKELESAVREHGVENYKEVDLAILELNGSISVISNNFTQHSSHKRQKALHPKLNRD